MLAFRNAYNLQYEHIVLFLNDIFISLNNLKSEC